MKSPGTMKIIRTIEQDHAKYFRRKNNDGFKYKYALNHTERKALVRDSGVQALVLFEYYLRLASTEDTVITDEGAAAYFGWQVRTAGKWRRVLENAGWLSAHRARQSNGHVMHTYYLEQEEVAASKQKPVRRSAITTKPQISKLRKPQANKPKKPQISKPTHSLFRT